MPEFECVACRSTPPGRYWFFWTQEELMQHQAIKHGEDPFMGVGECAVIEGGA